MRPMPKGSEATAEAKARGYEAETEDKILASRPVCTRCLQTVTFQLSELGPRTVRHRQAD